ncbi:MAG: hypothetical protein IIZ70_03740 [Kiritimatiellae bacterium]|nr:hypothetical protein [Kiritimatiellia bacterium]
MNTRCLSLSFAAMCAAFLSVPSATAQTAKQTIALSAGWNAFYLEVDPAGDASDPAVFFDSRPVVQVGRYVQGASLATAQFDSNGRRINGATPSYLVWIRGDAELSTLARVTGGAAYICYATNSCTFTVEGRPVLPRFSWRDTSGDDTPQNLVGVSVDPDDSATLLAYFREGPCGSAVASSGGSVVIGRNAGAPLFGPVKAGRRLTNGNVVALDSTAGGYWPGVINVTCPVDGMTIRGTEGIGVLSVVNAGTTGRTVRVSLAESSSEYDQMPSLLKYVPVSGTNTDSWTEFNSSSVATNRLAAGEEWSLRFAADPKNTAALSGSATNYAALFRVEDLDGGTKMRVLVPLKVEEAATDGNSGPFPQGLWAGTVTLSQVNRGGGTDYEPAGGPMKMTVLMHVDSSGKPRLLQRVVAGTTNDLVTGRSETRLYTSPDTVPAGWSSRRYTCVVVDVANQVVAADSAAAAFGSEAKFSFVVGERARDNPFRHSWHPDHDGKSADYSGDAPSGDSSANFIGTIKPEMFSITNTIDFVWKDASGASTYSANPEGATWGRCDWDLGGLRADGPVKMRGTFMLRRLSNDPELDD